MRHYAELHTLARKQIPIARRVLGPEHDITLDLQQTLAHALWFPNDPPRRDLLEAEAILQDVLEMRRHVFGLLHKNTRNVEKDLREVREELANLLYVVDLRKPPRFRQQRK